MSSPRQPLYQRLPEIYRIKDTDPTPSGQLQAFLDLLEQVPAALRDDIEALYHDLFIETCADWVVPYIADLLGTSHLSGDPWTLRADVARTIFHRRRKGTLGAVESLAYTLSGWAARAVELRENLVWHQHLNHQRPDAGGNAPARAPLSGAVRGGTLPLRAPAALSLLDGPFDDFAHLPVLRPGGSGAPLWNLPRLAVWLWRLEDYRVPVADPGWVEALDLPGVPGPDEAAAAVRCIVHPMADPMVLFNRHRYRMDDEPPELSRPDEVPGPMPRARLTSAAPQANPDAYVRVDHYSGALPLAPGVGAPGLVLHVPAGIAPPAPADDANLPPSARWRFRGADLCAWEAGLSPPLRAYEVAIDPGIGRVLFGLADRVTEADPLAEGLLISYVYGFPGPTGAHPLDRAPRAGVVPVNRSDGPDPLEDALANLPARTSALIIEIQDSATYDLDLGAVAGAENDAGTLSLRLAEDLTIRAATGQRPVIRLQRPLRFRPADAAAVPVPSVTLEGLYLTWDRAAADFAADDTPIIARAAVESLVLAGCTLDPGGAWQLDGSAEGSIQPSRPAVALAPDYGFGAVELAGFDQVPRIELSRSITGAVRADADAYLLAVSDSILDAGSGPAEANPRPAIAAFTDPVLGWGPALAARALTCFGTVRVTAIGGLDRDDPCEGLIVAHPLQVQDDQHGCIRWSFLSGAGDRLPAHQGCVFATLADVSFTDLRFGRPGYGQLRRRSDPRILEQGPGRDLMGAFGYLRDTHKWKNIGIRLREYLPVGVQAILIPVT